MKRSLFVAPLIILSLLALAVLACGSTTPKPEPAQNQPAAVVQTPYTAQLTADAGQAQTVQAAPTPTPPPIPTDTPQPAPPTPTPAPSLPKLGETATLDGYTLSAVSVENPTTPGRLYTAEAGKKLVAVEIILGNESGAEPLNVNPLYATLVDSDGFTYDCELAGRDGQIDTRDLAVGEKVKGWIAFEIPEAATPASLKFGLEIFGDKALIVSLVP